MKKYLSIITATLVVLMTSCNKDELPKDQTTCETKNTINIKFDNGIQGVKLELNKEYDTNNGEKIKISALDYIVGNFVLINDKGEETKVEGFHIISEGGTINGKQKTPITTLDLPNIPTGKYVKMRFGLGVDKETFKKQTEKYKADGKKSEQIDLWTVSKKYGLVWAWTSGYKFTQFEGTFTTTESKENKENKGFTIHIASKGETDLYRTVEVGLSNGAIVNSKSSPQIHVKVDIFNILSGYNKIKLSDGSNIMGGEKAKKIAENTTKMFIVHHVHNGNNKHN